MGCDRISSDSSVSDSESNDASVVAQNRNAKRSKSKRPTMLNVNAGADLMNGPLLATPTGASQCDSKPNPRKRAFFMMGMFLFTALFGGTIVNMSGHGLPAERQLLPFPRPETVKKGSEAKSVVSLNHHRHHSRHLMSVAESEFTPTSHAGSVDSIGSPSTQKQQEASSVALWNDLVKMPVNGTGTCLAANLLSSVSSAVNASQELAKGKLFPRPKSAKEVMPKKLRGVGSAVVPYTDMNPSKGTKLATSEATRAISSVMTLQQHMQAAMSGPSQNASTILCPKPYGLLGANISHTLDDNLVLLLPSSSVAQVLNTVPPRTGGKESAKSTSSAYEWDGTWVEVDATITAIRQIPTYGGKLGGQTNRALLL